MIETTFGDWLRIRFRQAVVCALVLHLGPLTGASGQLQADSLDEQDATMIDLSDPSSAFLKLYNSTADDTRVGSIFGEGYTQPVATGDINGDGLRDVIVGAPYSRGPDNRRNLAGKVVAYFGRKDGTLTGVRDGATAAPPAGTGTDVTIYGSTNTGLGSVITIADLNGDGIDDFAIGAPSASPAMNQGTFGAVYIYFGSRSFTSGTMLDLASQVGPPPDAVFGGISSLSLSGGALAAGDVNNDGKTDLLVGAQFWNKGTSGLVGAAFLFLGRPNLTGFRSMAVPVTDPSGPDGAFAGIDGGDHCGQAVAVGDLNGDRIGDLIIAAGYADGPTNGRADSGEIYVILGGPIFSGRVPIDLAAAPADIPIIRIYGGSNGDAIGASLILGDFNGDTRADLLAGAAIDKSVEVNDTGFFHIFFGGSNFAQGAVRDLSTGPAPTGSGADAKIIGPGRNQDFQRAGAAADVNGDGRSDLLLPASLVPKGLAQGAGAVYLILGRPTFTRGVVLNMSSSEPGVGPDMIILGAMAQDRAGSGVAIGDINGDGKPELLISSAGGDGPTGARANSGTVYALNPPLL
ncbi:MAG: FG-GAP repeat protein [Acidobacteria bacterium]|nr:FG-GAP repeat protein [Acidobacteriota bacterium]